MISNRLVTNGESSDFDDYAQNIYVETNNMVSYIANNNVDFGLNMSDFINRLGADVQSRGANSEFVFVFGNNSELNIINIGMSNVFVVNDSSSLNNENVFIVVPGISQTEEVERYNSGNNNLSIDGDNDYVSFYFNQNTYNFTLSEYNRAMFIIKEEFNDEIYIQVK
jgi:UDP-N-acetylglucosamine 2-epimerase